MNQKDFEDKLDGFAEKFSHVVSDGIKHIEEAFEKGKERIKTEDGESAGGTFMGLTGSPKLGVILVALGIVWLLHSLGVFRQPILPILLIILGVYFIVRNR